MSLHDANDPFHTTRSLAMPHHFTNTHSHSHMNSQMHSPPRAVKMPAGEDQWTERLTPGSHATKLASPTLSPFPAFASISHPHHAASYAGAPSGLGSLLAAHKASAAGSGAGGAGSRTSSSPHASTTIPAPLMQRSESVPSTSSCGSAGSGHSFCASPTESPAPSPAAPPSPPPASEPAAAAAAADAAADEAAPASSTVASTATTAAAPPSPPCPISLWYGCEDATHARAVLAFYSQALGVCTTRRACQRAPLEFIGRVKRERVDMAKLQRLLAQRKKKIAAASAAPRQRYASAADQRLWRGLGSSSGRKSVSSPCLSAAASPACSPLSPSFLSSHAPSFPLSSPLPPSNSLTTLDLISIYSHDTLPLGWVFPLVRHEWALTTWHEADGVPESLRRLRTEYEAEEEDEEEQRERMDREEWRAESEAKEALRIVNKCIIKHERHHGSSKRKHSSSNASSTSSVSSAASSSASSSPPTSSSSSSPSPLTSYLYNLPIYSEAGAGVGGCGGAAGAAFDTFGCRELRPLGARSLGKARKDATTSDARNNSNKSTGCRKSSRASSHDSSSALPSSVGYSGAQTDCIYTWMQLLGRKTKCNTGGDEASGEGEANLADQAVDIDAMAAAACAALNQPESPVASPPSQRADAESESLSRESSVNTSTSRSHDDDDDDDDEQQHDDLHDIGDDVGFEFGRASGDEQSQSRAQDDESDQSESDESDSDESDEEESDEESDSESDSDSEDEAAARARRRVSSTQAVAIKCSPARSAPAARKQRRDSIEFGSSPFSPALGSIAAGSLGDELQAQLAALGLKR